MSLRSSARGVRFASILAGLFALLAAGVFVQARDLDQAVRGAGGAGTFRLTLGHGGSLSAELELASGASAFVVQAALVDDALNGEAPGLVTGRIDGFLRDSASLSLVASFEGEFAILGDNGSFEAVVHPLSGPDPWKVDIGAMKGQLRAQGVRASDGLSAARLWGAALVEVELAQELGRN